MTTELRNVLTKFVQHFMLFIDGWVLELLVEMSLYFNEKNLFLCIEISTVFSIYF